MDGAGQGPDGHRLGQPRHTFHQDVPVGEQPDEEPLDHVSLADDDPADLIQQAVDKGALRVNLLLNRFDIVVHGTILGRCCTNMVWRSRTRPDLMDEVESPSDVQDEVPRPKLGRCCAVRKLTRNGFVRLTLRAAQCRDAHSTIPLPSASLSA